MKGCRSTVDPLLCLTSGCMFVISIYVNTLNINTKTPETHDPCWSTSGTGSKPLMTGALRPISAQRLGFFLNEVLFGSQSCTRLHAFLR